MARNAWHLAEPSGIPPGPAQGSRQRHPLQRSNRRGCCLRDVIYNEGVPFRPHRGVLWVHRALFVPGDLDPWPLTLTFKLVQARDQTRLPCEFGTNPFSGSRDIFSYTNKKVTDSTKNRTLHSSLCAVKIGQYYKKLQVRISCLLFLWNTVQQYMSKINQIIICVQFFTITYSIKQT